MGQHKSQNNAEVCSISNM